MGRTVFIIVAAGGRRAASGLTVPPASTRPQVILLLILQRVQLLWHVGEASFGIKLADELRSSFLAGMGQYVAVFARRRVCSAAPNSVVSAGGAGVSGWENLLCGRGIWRLRRPDCCCCAAGWEQCGICRSGTSNFGDG